MQKMINYPAKPMKTLLVDFSKLTKNGIVDMFIRNFECGSMLAEALNEKYYNNISAPYDKIVFKCLDKQRVTASFFEGFFSKINYKKESVKDYILCIDSSELGFFNEKEMLSGAKKNFYKNICGE